MLKSFRDAWNGMMLAARTQRNVRVQLTVDQNQLRQQTPPVELRRVATQQFKLRQHRIVQVAMRDIGCGGKGLHQRFLFPEAGPGTGDKPVERLEQAFRGLLLQVQAQYFDLGFHQLVADDRRPGGGRAPGREASGIHRGQINNSVGR